MLLLMVCFVIKSSVGQINGDFWWLNENVSKLKGVNPSPVIYGDLNDLGTDESDLIIFRDDVTKNTPSSKPYFKAKVKNTSSTDDNFVFEDTDFYANDRFAKTIKYTDKSNYNQYIHNDKIVFPDSTNNKSKNKTFITSNQKLKSGVESICTYLTNEQCVKKNGIIYNETTSINKIKNADQVRKHSKKCCILPLITDSKNTNIVFPSTKLGNLRNKRNSNDENSHKNQRQRYLLRNRNINLSKATIANNGPSVSKKIVSPDYEYDDPYWNIKNTASTSAPPNPYKNNYGASDTEDYVVEVPKPGRLGLFPGQSRPLVLKWASTSMNRNVKQSSNGYNGATDDDYYDPVIDDRLDEKATGSSGYSVEESYEMDDEYDQSVRYRADPDFQVLEGFQLLNLRKNAIRSFKRRKTRANSLESNKNDVSATYKNCGKTVNNVDVPFKDNASGGLSYGSQPWLALVIRTTRRQRTLCYATLIHPRAALTAANCVYGAESDEIKLNIGQWDLNVDQPQTQERIVNIYLHTNYQPRTLDHDIAILHWTIPLSLEKNVRPACVASLQNTDHCIFIGWGDLNQEEILPQPRWQSAKLLNVQECFRRFREKGIRTAREVLCATVQSQDFVSGVGGALVCARDGVQVLAAVVSWSADTPQTPVLLQPVYSWTLQALSKLRIS